MTEWDLKASLSDRWDWNDPFNETCLKNFLYEVNKGITRPTEDSFTNFCIDEATPKGRRKIKKRQLTAKEREHAVASKYSALEYLQRRERGEYEDYDEYLLCHKHTKKEYLEVFSRIALVLLIVVPLFSMIFYTIVSFARGFNVYDVKIGKHEYRVESVGYFEKNNQLVFTTMKGQKIFPVKDKEHSVTFSGKTELRDNDKLIVKQVK
jgi:hypothetical protein